MKIKSTLLLAALTGFAVSASAGVGFTSIDQLCGEYSLVCAQLDDDNYESHFAMNMTPGAAPNEVIFNRFYYIDDFNLPATVDFETGTVTFKKMEEFTYLQNYEGMASFLLYKWNSTHTRASEVDEVTGTILEDGMGTIVFDPDYYFSIVVPDGIKPGPSSTGERGYQVVCELGSASNVDMYFQPAKHEFIYFPEQWQFAGSADFTGMWIAPMAGFNNGENTLTYKVNYYENKQNINKLLLMNPYGSGTPWTDPNTIGEDYLNVSDKQGYFFIDTTDPNFVLVASGVSSGYSSEAVPSISCSNEEGLYTYDDGYDRSTVKTVLQQFGVNEYSFRKGNDITIRNLVYIDEKTHYLSERAETYVSYITLNPGDDSGVEGIDVENAGETRYYNLMGVEVKNPTKGQILIERTSQGARKIIAQ